MVREVQNVDRLKLDLNQKGIIDTADKNNNKVANSNNGLQNQQLQEQQPGSRIYKHCLFRLKCDVVNHMAFEKYNPDTFMQNYNK